MAASLATLTRREAPHIQGNPEEGQKSVDCSERSNGADAHPHRRARSPHDQSVAAVHSDRRNNHVSQYVRGTSGAVTPRSRTGTAKIDGRSGATLSAHTAPNTPSPPPTTRATADRSESSSPRLASR